MDITITTTTTAITMGTITTHGTGVMEYGHNIHVFHTVTRTRTTITRTRTTITTGTTIGATITDGTAIGTMIGMISQKKLPSGQFFLCILMWILLISYDEHVSSFRSVYLAFHFRSDTACAVDFRSPLLPLCS